MLDSTITLNHDYNRDATPTDEVWRRFEEFQNRSNYINDVDHESDSRCTLSFLRTLPTVSGNFRGTRKMSLKVTTDVEVPGVDITTTQVAPVIGTVSFSLPVGATAADILHLRERLIAVLDDQTIMTRLNELQEI